MIVDQENVCVLVNDSYYLVVYMKNNLFIKRSID